MVDDSVAPLDECEKDSNRRQPPPLNPISAAGGLQKGERPLMSAGMRGPEV
jgi:hypothetical protein